MAWVAAGLFVLLVVVATFWRLDADALGSAEQDRDQAISKAIAAEKALTEAKSQLNLDIDRRSSDFLALDRKHQQAQAEILSLKKTTADQWIENAALHVENEKLQGRLDAVLAELRVNLHSKRPASWKSLAARLLQETQA